MKRKHSILLLSFIFLISAFAALAQEDKNHESHKIIVMKKNGKTSIDTMIVQNGSFNSITDSEEISKILKELEIDLDIDLDIEFDELDSISNVKIEFADKIIDLEEKLGDLDSAKKVMMKVYMEGEIDEISDQLKDVFVEIEELNNAEKEVVIRMNSKTGDKEIVEKVFVVGDEDSEDLDMDIVKSEDGEMLMYTINMKSDKEGESEETIVINEGEDGKMEVQILSDENELDDLIDKEIVKEIRIKAVVYKCSVENLSKEERNEIKSTIDLPKKDNLSVDNMNIYPNPNDGKFTLSFNAPSDKPINLAVFNSEGNILLEKQVNNFSGEFKEKINISDLGSGVYFIKIKQGRKTLAKKIIVE